MASKTASLFLLLPLIGNSCSSAGVQPLAPEDQLKTLIAKTDALEGFTARYGGTSSQGEALHITLSYAAPDRALFVKGVDKGEGGVSVRAGRMTVDIPDDSGRRIFAIIDVDALEAAANQIEAQLLVEFSGLPPHEKHALTPGVMFTWNWDHGVPGEQKIVDLGVGTTSHRSFLCQWLTRLEGRREKPRETKDSLVWDLDSGYEVEVSKATGFVTRQRFTNQPNSNAELVLESLELKAPSDNAQFVAPEQAPEGAIVKSAEMAEQMSVQFRMRLRDYIWTQLPKSIDAKAVSWSERSPEQLTGVFHELYAPICSRNWAEYTKDMRAWIDSVAGKVASSLAKLEPDDESGVAQLIAGRAPARANLSGNIDEELQSLLQSIKPPTTVPTDFRLYDVFLECERSAIRVAYESQVKEPLLAYFTERIDAALAR